MPTHDSSQSRPQRHGSQVDDAEAADATAAATEASSDVAERHDKLTEDVDAILDEIDDVLETNAEDFVRSFVQKGWPVTVSDYSGGPEIAAQEGHSGPDEAGIDSGDDLRAHAAQPSEGDTDGTAGDDALREHSEQAAEGE